MSDNRAAVPFDGSLDRLLRPRSVAVIGVSPQKGSAGLMALANLENLAYEGTVHIVSRGRKEVLGKPCVPSIDEMPRGIDVAVLCVPREAVVDSIAACVRQDVGAVVVFASGFAEQDSEGEAAQAEMARIATESGIALLGPNCFGYQNYSHRLSISFSAVQKDSRVPRPTVGIVAQSGGMGAALRRNLGLQGIGATYVVATGNEAVLTVEDFLVDIIEDKQTRVVAALAEHLRKPQLLLKIAARARKLGKAIVLLHPGRGERAREAARSHTGALAGDHAIMRALVSHEAVIVLDSFQEWVDVTSLLACYPEPPSGGVGIITTSGAFRGMAFDLCERIGLDVPELGAATKEALHQVLPSFADAANPVDLTTQLIWQQDLVGKAAQALIADPAVGSIVIALTAAPGEGSLTNARLAIPFLRQSRKPVVYSTLSDGDVLHPEFKSTLREGGILFFRSPEAALSAVARVTEYAKAHAIADERARDNISVPPLPRRGTLTEYEGKTWLSQAGVPLPAGALATTLDQAQQIALRIGYPVVLKAQSRELSHKSDVGGVILDIAEAPALANAWEELSANVRRARPGVQLDGILVERMAGRGVEMVVGARRDPNWGPVVLVGLGGIWIETLNDVRLMPADLTEAQIIAEIERLRGAKLLRGARGTAPADIAALAKTVAKIGVLVRSTPTLQEIDINPLLVYPEGRGVVALDALVVGA